MITKKIKIIIILLGISLLLTGCGKEKFDASQINPFNEDEIEAIEIIAGNSSDINKFTDKVMIDSITNDLTNIKFDKLSVDEENKALDNGNRLRLDSTYIVLLNGKDEKILSQFILLSNNELLLIDIKSMGSNNRTILYINENDEAVLKSVMSIYSHVKQAVNTLEEN